MSRRGKLGRRTWILEDTEAGKQAWPMGVEQHCQTEETPVLGRGCVRSTPRPKLGEVSATVHLREKPKTVTRDRAEDWEEKKWGSKWMKFDSGNRICGVGGGRRQANTSVLKSKCYILPVAEGARERLYVFGGETKLSERAAADKATDEKWESLSSSFQFASLIRESHPSQVILLSGVLMLSSTKWECWAQSHRQTFYSVKIGQRKSHQHCDPQFWLHPEISWVLSPGFCFHWSDTVSIQIFLNAPQMILTAKVENHCSSIN